LQALFIKTGKPGKVWTITPRITLPGSIIWKAGYDLTGSQRIIPAAVGLTTIWAKRIAMPFRYNLALVFLK